MGRTYFACPSALINKCDIQEPFLSFFNSCLLCLQSRVIRFLRTHSPLKAQLVPGKHYLLNQTVQKIRNYVIVCITEAHIHMYRYTPCHCLSIQGLFASYMHYWGAAYIRLTFTCEEECWPQWGRFQWFTDLRNSLCNGINLAALSSIKLEFKGVHKCGSSFSGFWILFVCFLLF